SPLYFVSNITKPVLVTHGAKDANVPRTESDEFVRAMQMNSKPVTYLIYDNEGHDYERSDNYQSLFAVAEAFFREHLGGRCEPFDSDLRCPGLQVVTGGALIPGLNAALKMN